MPHPAIHIVLVGLFQRYVTRREGGKMTLNHRARVSGANENSRCVKCIARRVIGISSK